MTADLTLQRLRCLRLAILVCVGAAVCPARHLPIQVFTSAQGLPTNSMQCMLPGPTGVLWLCTSEGLVRFDGYRFRVFGPEEGLPSRNVLDLVPSREGGYWLASDKGFCRLPADSKVGQPCRLLEIDAQPNEFTLDSILESKSGETWISTSHHVYKLSHDGKRLDQTDFHVPTGELILMVTDGVNGAVLVGTDFGLYEWKPGVPPRKLSAGLGPLGSMSSVELEPGNLLFATTSGLFHLVQRNGEEWMRKEPVDGYYRVNSIIRRHDGSIWAVGNGGLARLEITLDGHVHRAEFLTTDDGLPSPDLTGLVEDGQGSLWVSTDGAGIFRLAASGFTMYSTADGLGNSRIASIFSDREGRLGLTISWGKSIDLRVLNGDRFVTVPLPHPASLTYFGWAWSQLVAPAKDGAWWVATGMGVLRYPKVARAEDLEHTTPQLLDGASALGCGEIFRLFEDSTGDVWVGCLSPKRGLVRWSHTSGEFHRFGTEVGYPENPAVMAVREAPDGVIWIGTLTSVIRFRGGKFESFPLIPGKSLAGMRDMLVDHAGRIWVATTHAGLLRCDNPGEATPVFSAYTVKEGLSSNAVNTVIEDRAGFIYAGTPRGVDRVDPHAPAGSRRVRHFGSADGLPESEQNTAYRDARGHLWFGTLRGLAEFDPSSITRQQPPRVYITRVRVRGEDVPLPWEGTQSLTLDLAANRNQVEIDYAGVDLRSADSLQYQYRMEGVDQGWTVPVSQLSVNYASLPPGPFRFEVRAIDADGQVSKVAAAFDLKVQAPLWRRWWFVTLLALLLAVAVNRIYDYRVGHLLALERLRTRIATDLHDDIGASLTQISILSELARREAPAPPLQEIASLARSMVQDMSDIVWAVNPRHDRFEGLVHRMRRFANDTLGGVDIDLAFEADKLPGDFSVPLEARRPLYLAFKEAVNNVARHSGATKAAISLHLVENTLNLRVEDNGRGFEPGQTYDGEGLASVGRRMKDVGGSALWESRPGAGTCFTAVLPLRDRASLRKLMTRIRGSAN
ncbi:MAG TPA: ATP-binding protein [Candidatus Sulfopaludibacter sp.]|jgi:ligand-binding sensor domain-containing protein/signal transduction histidine kinase|nr:ATP-binding protein [Candidatus Sulfopaludibacter sp.]